ncbi:MULTISPECIES: thiol-disulfide oxidoreductase ResA [unclassified Bacillus (in: firmicutes)]|uniref:thiol-disulfide oxidoreductase ResA n=1 Tax=unclassified Bacillus (in: firmicutes) TaxID=185979 RepID=UPI000D0482CB|nr:MULTISPECIES: thiol-disulfide oxidoreductase ResA [unclassified Bacillus (in: firmicutes)]PRS83710.1 thiol-disulfide oxidoreductase [Bacillus sp. CJCL2]PRS88456.1 thiol-disulfide oxidoreductase [Bacillus sp. YBWC18]
MKKRRFFIRTGILLVMLAALCYTMYNSVFAKQDRVKEGSIAPNFVLQSVDGEQIELKDLKGKGIFLNFWGTWCGPCKQEFPYMSNQYEVFKNRGVEIVAVNVAESNIAVKNFMESYGVNFPVAMDKDRQVTEAYDIGQLPTTLLINPEGKVIKVIKGTMTERNVYEYMHLIKPKGS